MTTTTSQPLNPRNGIPDFESLVRTLRPQLVRFLANIVGETEAEDVVQGVFAKAAVALPTFRGEASPRTWLFSIATNAARDWLRGHTRPEEETIDTFGAEPVDAREDASQERRLVREQMSQCVGEFLRRLPPSYQVVLALSDCEELADQEIASILGMTLGATKIRLHRARTKLREEIERGCSLYRDEQGVLCCDRKESAEAAYRLDESTRLQEETNKTAGSRNDLNEVCTMTAVEILPGKQKSLIGVGASIAAGCQPCTLSFAAAARQAGACDRGVRFAVESGLAGRQRATASMSAFASEKLAAPELDAAFRAEKAALEALIDVATAIASNAATLVKSSVDGARARGATDDQIRAVAELARIAQRGAERETDTALRLALGGAYEQACGAHPPTESGGACACGSSR